MDIYEAIEYHKKVAEEMEEHAESIIMSDEYGVYIPQVSRIRDDAEEHRQHAEWLTELTHLRNITEYLRDSFEKYWALDGKMLNGDIIEWAKKELSIKEVNE